ncbi:MAG TPA: hypothetical protein VMC06_03055 [Opitutaceae bacterium]|nr:hypothetical protein [Opitutaceae bacterium]
MERLTSMFNSLADYPRWLVVACLAIVGALAIYVVAKLLKWSLYLLMVVVLVGGLGLAVWLLLR